MRLGIDFNVVRILRTISGLTISDFSFTGARADGRIGVNGPTAFVPFIPEEDHFSITLAANSVRLNGVAGPANAVTFAYTGRPTLALRLDTGNPTDRITRNRGIDVTLASNFDHNTDTWGYSTNFGTTYIAGSGTHFGLPDGVYRAGFVRVRQTVKGTISDDDFLQRFTFDATRPTINLNGGDITLTAGQTYTEQASVSDNLDASVMLRVGGDTLDTSTAGTYDLTYDAQDAAGNDAVQRTRTVTVSEPVTLSALTVSPGTLMPDFDPAITAYNVIVGTGVNSISFTPTFRAGTVVIEVARVFGGMISSGSTSSRGFSGTRATYNIAVTNGGVSTTYSVTATRNTAPVADAGDDDTAATNAPVALDGSGSSDPNSHVGDTLSYAWEHTLTNGTAPATAITLTDADTDSPIFTPTAAGAYTFTLTVTDSVGASHTDTVVITVTEPPDTTPPTVITFDDPAAGVIGTAQDHDITFDEAVTGLAVGDFSVSNNIVASGDLVVNSVTPASGPGTTYTISITPQATAFTLTLAADSVMDTATTPNPGPANAASASGSATAVLAFTAAPALTTNNADPQRAKAGDILTLTFTVNQALASVPVVVTIAGQPITPTGTAGNVYTATYTVVAAEVTDEGAVVSYSTGTLTAAGPAGNTAQITDDSAIRIDLTAPTITLTGGDAPVVLAAGEAYTEQGATATDNVDVSVPTPTWSGAVDTDTAGEYTITYTATDRAGNVATKTRTVTVRAPVTATAPEPPVLVAGTITDTSVVLEWTAVDNADSYTLTRVVAGGANVVVASDITELTATDTGLTADTPYKYTITATNSAGTSAASAEFDARTDAAPVTATEPTVTVERLPDNSIKVSWDNIGGVDFTIYAIKTGVADAVIIEEVQFSPHTITTTDSLFDTVNNADAIGIRGFSEGNPVGDHLAPITSDEVPDEAPAVTDTNPPTVTLGTITEGVIGTAQDYDITFSEAVTGLAVGDFSVSNTIVASGDLVVNSVTPASGPSTTYTISIIPRATAFTLTLAANSVMDTATIPNMGPATAASAIGSATAAVALTAPGAQSYTLGTAVDLTLPAATGGTAPLTYTLTGPADGALPTGLTFTAASRTLSGTPGTEATTTLTYTVTDANDATATADFTVTVNAGLVLTAPGDQNYTVDTPITALILPAATGGTGTLRYALTGLPAGLSFNAGTRTLSGTPTAAAATELTYTVTDTNDASTSQTFTVTVNTGLALTAPDDQSYTVGTAITALVLPAATGGTGTLTYTLTGALPTGLTFTAASRTLSGTPTAVTSATTLTYTVTDANGASTSQTFTVTVNDGVVLTAPDDQGYTVDTAIDALILPAASGGTGTLSYALTGPAGSALPGGLTFAAGTRTLSGTPTAADVTVLTYMVTDANDATAVQTFTVTVNTGLALPAPGAQGYTVDTAINDLILPAATGGTAPLSYTLTGLPGLSFTAGTRTLSGTPSTVGSTALAYRVTDANGATASQTFMVTVNEARTPPPPRPTVPTPEPDPEPEPEPNTAPMADAGAPPIAAEGATVTLNGRGSSDPDDDTLTYAWRQTGGTSVSLSGANTATPGFTAPSLLSADAELVFRLTVSDGSLSATDTVTVTVTHVNDAPDADAGEPQTVAEGAAVTLRGTGTDPDGDDAALRYAWSQTDTGAPRVSLSGADTATPGFTAPSLLSADAELVFRLTVSDGSLSATDTVTITVTRPRDTVAPVITLLGDSPLEVNQGATYADPGATASDDRDGDLDSVGIVVGGDTVDTDTIGAYNVTYDVSDAAGNAAATVTRIVRVVVPRDLAALNEAILPEVARDIADRNVSAIARRIEQARLPSGVGTRVGSSASLGGASSLAEIATSQGSTVADDRFDLKRLLNNSNFVLPLSATGAGAADGTQLTLWGAGDYRDLKGADGVRWSGDLLSLQLGLDAHLNERTILGVSVSKSQVELNYTNPGPAAGGNYDLDITSVHPYLGWTAGGLDFWATLGYGEGELEISADGGAQTDIPSSDLSMQTLGLGANGVLMATGTTTVLLKTEALSTQLEVDASEGITAITQQAHRMRMTLEAIRGHSLDSGARLETSLEAGLRYDGGDGETGAGAELGGGLRYANHSGSLVIEGRARALVGGKGDTEEWGLSGLITYNPAANGRGLSFSLTPGYGVTASGVERLWQQGLDDGLEAQGGTDGNNYTPNLDLRLDYGMDVSAMPGLVTPYTEFSFGATGDTYRLGLQWQRSKWFDLKLVAEREAGQITADHRIYIEGEIVF